MDATTLDIETNREISSYFISGMIEITFKDYIQRLNSMGYTIDERHTFDYINTANKPNSYRCRAFHVIDIESKLSFANNDCKNVNLSKLQYFRDKFFTIQNGKICQF